MVKHLTRKGKLLHSLVATKREKTQQDVRVAQLNLYYEMGRSRSNTGRTKKNQAGIQKACLTVGIELFYTPRSATDDVALLNIVHCLTVGTNVSSCEGIMRRRDAVEGAVVTGRWW